MGDFLDNLAAKSLNRAPLLEPRPVSQFEPWQPGGVLGAASPRVHAPSGSERDTDRVEAARPWFPHENDVAPPTHLDRSQREAPLAPTLQSFLPLQPDSPAMTLPTVFQPAPRSRESYHDEALPAVGRDQSGVVDDERLSAGPRTAPLATPIVQRTEHVEHVIVEHQEPHGDVPAIGLRSEAEVETSRAPASAAPVIERTERVIIERERATQEHEAVPGVVRPAVSSAPAFLAPAPQVEPQAIIEKMPPQHLVNAQNAAHSLVTPIIERIERVPETSDRGGVDRRGTAPRLQHDPAESRRSPAPQSSTPTIHVTIGRIEVRAAPSPAPVKRASSPAATMSLEEYLRSRSGDRR